MISKDQAIEYYLKSAPPEIRVAIAKIRAAMATRYIPGEDLEVNLDTPLSDENADIIRAICRPTWYVLYSPIVNPKKIILR